VASRGTTDPHNPTGRWWYGDTMEASTRITLRLPSELHTTITDLAGHHRRSLNSELVWLLELAVAEPTLRQDGESGRH
jgi:hypothetical protein